MDYRILGPLEVLDGDREVKLGSHKQRAILAILLIEAGRVVSTDALIDRLWGDEPPATAVATLQAYLSNLRRALEPDRSIRQPSKILVSTSNGYSLRVDEGELDAAHFEHLFHGGKELLEKQRFVEATTSLEAALSLWRGGALSDFEFDSFANQEISRLEELRMSALEARIEADLALGRHGKLVAELRPLVERHQLRERLRGQLALALYRDARQADALEVLREGRARLAEDLGIDPGPELRRLEEAVLRQDSELDWQPPPRAAAVALHLGPLLARDAELDVLERAAESARSGWGRLVLVGGEAGIGKTRLAEEFTAGNHALEVLWGRCLEGEGAPPLWPWVQVLKAASEAHSTEELLGSAGNEASDLVHLLPEVLAADPGLHPSTVRDAEEARFRLNVAVTALLTRLASARPVAVVLDDLHWADVASLRMLEHLAGELRQASILVVATYRDVEVSRDHPLSDALATISRLPVVERIMLSGLGVEEVGSYVSSVAGFEPTPASVRMIHERTEGNPFFVAELTRLLQNEGALNDDASLALGSAIPANVRDVILRRVSRLPDASERVLTSGAVIGREFPVDLLASVEGLDWDGVLDLIEPAIASRVLVAGTSAMGRYRFSHGLVRETLYDNLTPVKKARLHLRVAESLESRREHGEVGVSEIAHHFFQAAGAGPADKAADYALRAADHALAHLAFEEAEDQLRRALDVLELVPARPERARRELSVQTRLGGLLMMIRGYAAPGVEAALVRARDLSRELGDADHLVACLWRLFVMHQARTDTRAAIAVSEELFEATREKGDATTHWMGYQAKGVAAWLMGDLSTAEMQLEKALALAHSADASAIIAHEADPAIHCLGALALTRWLLGERREGKALIDEQLARARDLGQPFGLAYALMFQARLGVFERDAPLVRNRSEELVALAKQRGFHLFEAVGTIFRGWAEAETGDVEAGRKQMLEGLDAFENTGVRMMGTVFFALLAEAHQRAARAHEALAAIDRGLAEAEAFGERFYEAELCRLRGQLLLEISSEETAEAEASFRRALEIARAQGARSLEARAEASLELLA